VDGVKEADSVEVLEFGNGDGDDEEDGGIG
jgi:hypothetical protein